MYFDNKVTLKGIFTKLSKKLFFVNVHLKQNYYNFFKYLRPHFQNIFVSRLFFLMLSVLSFRMKHKKLLKTKHQCTFAYIMNFTNFYPFLGISAALQPSFYQFFEPPFKLCSQIIRIVKRNKHRSSIELPKVPLKETTIGSVQNEAPFILVVSNDEFHA